MGHARPTCLYLKEDTILAAQIRDHALAAGRRKPYGEDEEDVVCAMAVAEIYAYRGVAPGTLGDLTAWLGFEPQWGANTYAVQKALYQTGGDRRCAATPIIPEHRTTFRPPDYGRCPSMGGPGDWR